jgi:hypothetical protein
MYIIVVWGSFSVTRITIPLMDGSFEIPRKKTRRSESTFRHGGGAARLSLEPSESHNEKLRPFRAGA